MTDSQHPADSHDQLRVRGARVNNLKDVDRIESWLHTTDPL